MKFPFLPIFGIAPRCFLDVSGPHPAKSFHFSYTCGAMTVNPIQFTLRYLQGLVQPSNRQIRFVETYLAIPLTVERLRPLPFHDRRGLSTQLPSMIQLMPKRRGQLQKILCLKDISLDTDAPCLGIQIVRKHQVPGVFRRHAAALRQGYVARFAAKRRGPDVCARSEYPGREHQYRGKYP